ncbi:MAG: flagellar motor protein [Thermodesulfovibrio sp.]|uniref:flagellar motor protein n=3 Tax=unclassified Thermodesulfovibrio TaxID=2645936 RepID=UPI002482AFAA|nr:flagellar motor protein [Thermodesulfovibrio sp. 1176]MDI1472877.1 flagellar motor protein [Thermodesulfovibrio sp. 1176]MDI6714882.1 flagellar motor protein [Thermodesulfovibrio sp.]
MDFIALLGLIIGICAVVVGNIVEGGTTGHLVQLAAAIIVFGGTIGAVLLSFPLKDLNIALKSLKLIFINRKISYQETIDIILELLILARRRGLLAIQNELDRIKDPFLRRGLTYIVDGLNSNLIKDALEREILAYEEMLKKASRVFESAGGYAPTIGIIGAILGLIHVLKNVADPTKIGVGIATAFVATIYGVGSANLLFIPISKRLINKMEEEIILMELMIEGILAIEAGMNPYYLRAKLEAFINERQKERL